MRAVALSDAEVQARIKRWFVPLKVVIDLGTKRFPLDWPAMRGWSAVHDRMGGEKCEGITLCSVVSPDLQVVYATTGSAMVWEMFDSIAYDATKFYAMLDGGARRARTEREIRANETLDALNMVMLIYLARLGPQKVGIQVELEAQIADENARKNG